MYHRRERPLSEDERQRLTSRLKTAREQTVEAGFVAFLLLLFDGVVVLGLVMLVRGQDRSGACGWCVAGIAIVLANLFLLANVSGFLAGRQEKRELREALADGVAVVEEVTAESAAEVGDRGDYH